MTQILIIRGGSTRPQVFLDPTGVSHEALDVDPQIGVVLLCGQLRDPIRIDNRPPERLRAYVSPEAPEGVDCMTCLVRRVDLDHMFDDDLMISGHMIPAIRINLQETL